MPKNPINYSNSVIYKIQHLENPLLLYVGSTTDFTKRKYQHKQYSLNVHNNEHRHFHIKLYKTIRENGGWDHFNMIIIKEFPCNNKTELLIEEDKILREMKTLLNTYNAYQSDEDYKKMKSKKNKKYRDTHRDVLLNKTNCECGGHYCYKSKERHMKTKKHQLFLI